MAETNAPRSITEPLIGCVQHDCEACKAKDAELAAAKEAQARAEAALEIAHNGERMVAGALMPSAEKQDAEHGDHNTGEVLSLLRFWKQHSFGNKAPIWMDEMKQRAESAERRLTECERDAERYLKLCRTLFLGSGNRLMSSITITGGGCLDKAAIDAAIAKESDECPHGRGLTDYCEPCGRIHGGS